MTNINKKHLAKEIPLTETVFGHEIQDNYRYFENTKDKYALAWVEKQSEITQNFLNEDNVSAKIYEEFLELDKSQEFKYFRILSCKKHIYYIKRHFSELRGKLYRTNYSTNSEELLFDFSSLDSKYKGEVKEQLFNVSPNEKFLSFIIGVNGSESGAMHLLNLETIKLEKDIIEKTRSFYAEWISDNSFLYVRFPNVESNDGSGFKKLELKYHKIGSNCTEDFIVCSENNNKEIDDLGETNWFSPYYDRTNNQLYISHSRETDEKQSLYRTAFDEKSLKVSFIFKKIFGFDEEIKSTIIKNDKLFYFTSKFSKDFELRISSINEFDNKKAIKIEKFKNETFEEDFFQDKHSIYCITIKETYNKLYKLNVEHLKLEPIETNLKASIYATSYAIPENIVFGVSNFKYNNKYFVLKSNALVEHSIVNCKSNIDSSDIVVTSDEYISHDGVMVPITFAYKKGLIKHGKNRCLIHAYGSYGMNYLSYFSNDSYRWFQNGGIVAIAHVRGGGEKGKPWHLAGKKSNKINTWQDLIFAGKYLIDNKFTSKEYLACEGTSAGGITVGMTANEEKDVFGAILSNVGSNNVTRLGRNPGGGTSEFGNPTKEKDFDALLKMDVFQNIKEGKKYTNILFSAGMKDDRVDYWKPAKAAAKMQKCTSSNNRIAYIAYENLGHGGLGSSRKDYLIYLANQFAFLEKVLKK